MTGRSLTRADNSNRAPGLPVSRPAVCYVPVRGPPVQPLHCSSGAAEQLHPAPEALPDSNYKSFTKKNLQTNLND